MSEAYWLAGERVEAPSPTSIKEWLKKNGIQAAWIDEIHWLSQDGASALTGWPEQIPVFTWQSQPLLGQALLDAACRSILTGERDLILCGENGDGGADVLVLGSPQAVGRYNRVPSARLVARFPLPADGNTPIDLVGLLSPELEKIEVPADKIGLIAVCGDSKRLSVERPKGWKLLPAETKSAVGACNALVTGLERTRAEMGLLVSLAGSGAGLAALVERI